ncbi:type IV toxin-antitoxin system AbiEi family antitoxin [Microbacterium sp. SORGH_AS_0888]|uniref:type IV toxin-antitoxin system AbiEi family antitoxin n=1 Tax=Microbacterium sp. SORGH_AS_0888 TaxID=3041791 RepID=UPI0027D7E9A9|nr:type IV toxin-antitoxin system AbiEi family antitoxin [Microbacterium sp. SORGH_AS_0888]
MASSVLHFAGDRLSEPELCAARIDGHVVALGEGYLAADAIESPALRAASLRPLLGADTAATHESAAWIHGAIESPPARHSVQRITTTRKRYRPADPRCRYRTMLLPDADLVRIAGAAVSSPTRTLIDLAREGCDPSIVRDILTLFPQALPEALARLEASVVPGKRAALRLLRA